MQPNDAIKSGIAHIEQNLKTAITIQELADMAGYSIWHYCHLYTQATGLPVGAYICKRRLNKALVEISEGRKAVDVVPEYGFDTYAGFYKAFIRMYGCSPKKYLSLYEKRQSNKFGGIYMIAERELRDAIAHWDVPQNLPLNDVYILDGAKVSGNVWMLGDDYVLKTGERDRLLKDMRLHKALAAEGFTSAAPIGTKTGTDYLDGERIYTLMRKLPGGPLSETDRFGGNRREFGFKYGQSIAKLHHALSAIEADIMPDEKNFYEQVIGWAMPNVRKQNDQWSMGLVNCFFTDYAEVFGEIFDQMPKQLIHRDPNPSNILFDGRDISGFIDFDLSERNVRLWDPCYCATGVLCAWQGVEDIQKKSPDILRGILHGYDSVCPLTAEEKRAVFYVLCSIQMICVAYFESIDEYKELAKTNREMLRFIAENKPLILEIF